MLTGTENILLGRIFIIYRLGAMAGDSENITRNDDISRGVLPRGKYHH
jgi:hypothetical protein